MCDVPGKLLKVTAVALYLFIQTLLWNFCNNKAEVSVFQHGHDVQIKVHMVLAYRDRDASRETFFSFPAVQLLLCQRKLKRERKKSQHNNNKTAAGGHFSNLAAILEKKEEIKRRWEEEELMLVVAETDITMWTNVTQLGDSKWTERNYGTRN